MRPRFCRRARRGRRSRSTCGARAAGGSCARTAAPWAAMGYARCASRPRGKAARASVSAQPGRVCRTAGAHAHAHGSFGLCTHATSASTTDVGALVRMNSQRERQQRTHAMRTFKNGVKRMWHVLAAPRRINAEIMQMPPARSGREGTKSLLWDQPSQPRMDGHTLMLSERNRLLL